jgi:hypothetical protein
MVLRIIVSLRNRFKSAHHLQLVRLLLTVLPEEGGSGQAVTVDGKKLYKSVLSHSEFIPVMSNERDEKTKGMSCNIRSHDSLIETFHSIIRKFFKELGMGLGATLSNVKRCHSVMW